MKKKVLIGLIVITAIAAIAGVSLIVYLNNNLKALNEMTLEDIDLSEIPDGEYQGDYSVFPVSVKVKVTVTSHEITAIEIVEHDNGRGGAAEEITQDIIEAQSLDVDSITGATYSSRVILKAVENALKGRE
ncbi:MAG: FMN-binding protein [Christensenellales bacterium]|jgi:uncharacterized protein with FMN-binding domain